MRKLNTNFINYFDDSVTYGNKWARPVRKFKVENCINYFVDSVAYGEEITEERVLKTNSDSAKGPYINNHPY